MWRVFNHNISAHLPPVDLERGTRPYREEISAFRPQRSTNHANHALEVVSLQNGAMVILPDDGLRQGLVGENKYALHDVKNSNGQCDTTFILPF